MYKRQGIAGQKEKEGPYGAKFDQIIPDELNGQQSFESAERAMLEQAIRFARGRRESGSMKYRCCFPAIC